MKYLLFLILLFSGFTSFAQKVYSVQYENQADVKVFVVNYENQADLKVYKVKYSNEAKNNDGKWFFTSYRNQAS
ncbi:MAG: DUF6150 family protein, partial [Winogradskyella sp.]|nr:DUF6150 family protein [Winogradskyella sp.]